MNVLLELIIRENLWPQRIFYIFTKVTLCMCVCVCVYICIHVLISMYIQPHTHVFSKFLFFLVFIIFII